MTASVKLKPPWTITEVVLFEQFSAVATFVQYPGDCYGFFGFIDPEVNNI